ncbi:hypothetical protein CDIK_4058 [Cucumispora dikerogammari]|nr:hypothetical protein CDIK_4058 [Cucumispora dikerogammari]
MYYSVINEIIINDYFEKIYIEPQIHTQPNGQSDSIALKDYVTPWNIELVYKPPIVSFSFLFNTPTPELSRTTFQKQLVTTVGLKKFYKKNCPSEYCPRPRQTPPEIIPLLRNKDDQSPIDVFHFEKKQKYASVGKPTKCEHHISIEPKPGINILTKDNWLFYVNQLLTFMGIKSREELFSTAFQFSVSVRYSYANDHRFRLFCCTKMFKLQVDEEKKILVVVYVDKNNYFIDKKVV